MVDSAKTLVVATGRATRLEARRPNPLTDIRNTRQIDSIWIAGHRLAETTLSETR